MKPIDLVMLVDDDEIDNYAHELVLRKSKLVEDVIAFQDGQEGLDFLKSRERPVDLLFLDIRMPRMDGFEFLERYLKLDEDCKATAVVMMLTSSTNPVDLERARSFGLVREHLTKPLKVETVQELRDLYFADRPDAD